MEKSRRASFLFDDNDGDEDQNKQNNGEANREVMRTHVNRAGENNNNENFTTRGLPNDTSKDRSSGLLASLLCCCGPRRN
jgi:hypothetical protein